MNLLMFIKKKKILTKTINNYIHIYCNRPVLSPQHGTLNLIIHIYGDNHLKVILNNIMVQGFWQRT